MLQIGSDDFTRAISGFIGSASNPLRVSQARGPAFITTRRDDRKNKKPYQHKFISK
jgi:hypothetical protein